MPDDHMELTTNIIKNKGNELPCSSAIVIFLQIDATDFDFVYAYILISYLV